MDCYPLPHMEDLFTELAGATHYSQIDLSSAYHQLPLHPESLSLTAFITHEGVFQFTRVPFGLASAPFAFHTVQSSCTTCQTCDKTASTSPAPLQPVEFLEGPFQHVAVDIVGPFERGAYDCRFAITFIDYFSKWLEVAFTPTATTTTVMTFLASVFAREGNPCTITTYNGPQFTSSAFVDFLKERGIKHIRTSVYHPQANVCVERFNRVLKDGLQAAQATQQPWKPVVTEMLHSYRATAHATTGESPFQLLRGRLMWTKLNILPPFSLPREI